MAPEEITREWEDEMTRTGAPQRTHRAEGNSSEHQVPRVGNNQQWDSPLESDGEEDSRMRLWDSQGVPDPERKDAEMKGGQSSNASSGPKAECTASGTVNTRRTASRQQTRPVYRTAKDRKARGRNSRT